MTELLVIASTNEHKVGEIRDMLAGRLRVRPISAFGTPPQVEETGRTFVQNAVIKAEAFAHWLAGKDQPAFVLADDSGICIDALNGRPGVYSARFAGAEASDADNNAHMVAQLQAQSLSQSAAHYVCELALTHTSKVAPVVVESVGYHERHGTAVTVRGRCDGIVRTTARGSGGFGYDPHFWIDRCTRTFAELSRDEKAQRSHRGDALRRLRAVWPLAK